MESDPRANILIVDDVPGNIKTLAEVLRGEYRILVATSGKKALETVVSQPVDLILLDLVMPEMDGYEVCEKLNENSETAGIPVIFVTAQGEEVKESQGFSMGAKDYITKPASPTILKARIKVHLEAKKQREDLENLTIVDELTGVANRRHFDQLLDQEWRRAVRTSLSMAILMIDIDFFSRYIEHFGVKEGEKCLSKLAQTLKANLMRSTDLLARYEGREFVALLPQVEHHGGAITAQRLQKCIEGLKIPNPQSPISDTITISLGCASMMPTRGSSPQPMLEAAIAKLAQAKEQGYNQIEATFL
jgi:diguanylate cyclase (GGDEF)-like protein